jgi:hypothetical protein
VTATPEGGIVQTRTHDDGSERTAIHETALVEYACGLWESPPTGFHESFTEYLGSLDRIPLALIGGMGMGTSSPSNPERTRRESRTPAGAGDGQLRYGRLLSTSC